MSRHSSDRKSGGRSFVAIGAVAAMAAATTVAVITSGAAGASPAAGVTGYQIVQGPVTAVGAAGSPTESAAAYTQCPATKVALSAGVIAHNPLTFIRSTSPVSNTSWLVVVTNTATVADTFRTYSICVDASSVPGFHYVASAPVNIGSPGGGVSDVFCPTGEYAVGGGVVDHNPHSYLSISRPLSGDSRAWQVFVYNNAVLTYQENFTVFATCVPQADISTYNPQTTASGAFGTDLSQPIPGSPAKTNTAAAPFCPTGQVAVAGGGANHNQTFGYISSTSPSPDGRYWLTTSTNVNPPTGFTESSLPSDICVSGTATVTITAANASMTYGGTAPTFTYTVTGLSNGDTLTTPPTCTSVGTTSGVGTYPIVCSGADAGAHYSINYVNGTLTVHPAAAVVHADDQTKPFAAADPAFTYHVTGLVGTDALTTNPTCGVNATHVNVGTYAITCSGASAGSNYTLSYLPGTLTITPAGVTITADNQTKTYGAGDPTFTYSTAGLQGADTLTAPASCGVVGVHTNVGTYPIACSGANAGSNYTISYVAGTLTVTAASVVITADNQTKVYGTSDPTFTYSVSGLQPGDSLSTTPTCDVAATHVNVGHYAIACSGANAGSNYAITYQNGDLAITPATVTITADSHAITYGQAPPAFGFTSSGLVGGDALTTNPTCTVSGAHTNVGAYTISCSGADAGANYTIAYVDGTLTITPAGAAIVPNPQTITYGDADPAFTFQVTGLQPGDSLVTAPTCGVAGPHTNAGTYTITCSGGDAGPNYTLDQSATSTLTVNPKTVTITPNNKTKVYGSANPAFDATVTGLINGDTLVTQPTCGVAGPHKNVGTYTITCSGATAGPNYTVVQTATGTFTVTPKTLAIHPTNQTITYGDPDPTFTFTVNGLEAGDALITNPTCGVTGPHTNAGNYTITCSGADAGPNYTVDQTDTATLHVKKKAVTITPNDQTITYGDPQPTFTYTVNGLINGDQLVILPNCHVNGAHVNAGTYTIKCTGADAGSNYTVDQTATATLTINPKTVTVVPNPQSKTYGAPDPTFTFTVSGLINADTLLTQPTCGVTGAHVNAGTYTITCSGATAGPNYLVDQTATAVLTINRAAAAVTAQSPITTYGIAASSIVFPFEVVGLVNGDTPASAGLSGVTCGTTAPITTGGSYAAGTFPVTCTGPALTTNYTVTYVPGTLTVLKAVLNVQASNATRVFGAPNPTFSSTVTGYVNGDTAATAFTGSPAYTTTATATSDPGSYAIHPSTGTLASSNYSFTFGDGTLTITRAPLGVTAPDISKAASVLAGKMTFKTVVSNAVTGAKVSGVTVTFSVVTNNLGYTVSCTDVTNGNGVATCQSGNGNLLLLKPPAPYHVAVAVSTDYQAGSAAGTIKAF
jgi:hypothetical protein